MEMGIGYDTLKETWAGGIRHLQKVRLLEVSMRTQEEELRITYRRIPTAALQKKLEQLHLPALTRQVVREVLYERGKLEGAADVYRTA